MIRTLTVFADDSTVVDTGLSSNMTYTYQVKRNTPFGVQDQSDAIQVRTLDTTSHAWTFSVETLGGAQGSYLYDVVIINDTLAYAAGAIYLNDSSGALDPNAYNIARWNGKVWTPMRIQFYAICGQSGRLPYPASSVHGFDANDIWIAVGGDQIARWNGIQQTATMCLPISFTVKNIWEVNSSSVYVAGLTGHILHYLNGAWQLISSQTEVNLGDLSGSPDGSQVWTCGYYVDRHGTFLFRVNGSAVEQVYDGTANEFVIKNDSISGAISSVYAPTSQRLFVATPAGVYEASLITRGEARRISFTDTWFPGFPNKIRGNSSNDWFVVGDYTFIAHYNGHTLHYYDYLMDPIKPLYSVAQKGNLMIAVGLVYDPIHSQALIIMGRR